jgi:hypothetical protein
MNARLVVAVDEKRRVAFVAVLIPKRAGERGGHA